MYGGARDLLGIKPDLTAFGKIIGGGLPIGAYGGKEEIHGKKWRPLNPLIKQVQWQETQLLFFLGLPFTEVLAQEGVYEQLIS